MAQVFWIRKMRMGQRYLARGQHDFNVTAILKAGGKIAVQAKRNRIGALSFAYRHTAGMAQRIHSS